jgi:hypothetical protein
MQKENERWMPIEGYNLEYYVSDHGRIKSTKPQKTKEFIVHERIIKTHITWADYERVTLSYNNVKKKHYVARLVAFAFLGKPPTDKYQINHKDGNKLNNRLYNLEWVTPKQNIQHAIKNGLRKGKHDHQAVIKDYLDGMSYKDMRAKYNLSDRYIVTILELNNIERGRYKRRSK